jgi:hypothetical protein
VTTLVVCPACHEPVLDEDESVFTTYAAIGEPTVTHTYHRICYLAEESARDDLWEPGVRADVEGGYLIAAFVVLVLGLASLALLAFLAWLVVGAIA